MEEVMKYPGSYATVREIYESISSGNNEFEEKLVVIDGWVRTNRNMGNIGFISFNDGTCFKCAQLVYSSETENYEQALKSKLGQAITITGIVHLTPNQKQPFEIELKEYTLVGDVDDSYPLQKKKTSFEYLRTIPHIRPRANTFMALYRVRSVLSFAIHDFFQGEGFIYIQTPVLTSNDCEGAGQAFKVVTNDKNPETDYFGKPVSLTVSGQLHAEPFALTFRDVYTFGPTFRAEKSSTTRHAAEFWMIEPEIAFATIYDDIDLMEDFIKYIIKYVLVNCPDEMQFFNDRIEPGLLQKLDKVVNDAYEIVSYDEAIEILINAQKKGVKFEYSDIKWGMDLQSEHERYIVEKVFNCPVFLINFPKDIKAFYMKQNDDGKTVAGVDLLVPGIGEICGGSEREADYNKLKKRIQELHLDKKAYEWYLDTRRYGGCPHAGFGLGFDRLLMFITGMSNIRDVTLYPRTYKEILY